MSPCLPNLDFRPDPEGGATFSRTQAMCREVRRHMNSLPYGGPERAALQAHGERLIALGDVLARPPVHADLLRVL